jgi:membrane-associated phospholipid phosphatase
MTWLTHVLRSQPWLPSAVPCAAALLVLASLPAYAHAQPLRAGGAGPEPAPPFALQLSVDVPVFVVSAVIGAAWLLGDELGPAACAPRCDRGNLAAFDRVAAGRYDENFKLAADIGVVTVLAGTAGLLLLELGTVELVVGVEAVLVSGALSVVTMFATRRPRPFLYGQDAPLAEREGGKAALSFPSGHTANAFSAVAALFSIWRAHSPGSVAPYWALAIGGTLAAGVGVGRVLGGDHFPSDVLAGALIGSAIGWAVPALHRTGSLALTASPSGAQLTGWF